MPLTDASLNYVCQEPHSIFSWGPPLWKLLGLPPVIKLYLVATKYMWYCDRNIFGLYLDAWQKALGIFWMTEVSFVNHNEPPLTIPDFMLMRWLPISLQKVSKWGLVASEMNHMIEELELSVPPLNLQEGRRARNWVSSPKANDIISVAYIAEPQCRRPPSWGTHGGTRRMAHLDRTWKLSYVALFISSIWLFLSCILYNKLANKSKVFSWVL